MLDESKNRSLEWNLVIYVVYLSSNGLGPSKSQFMKLKIVNDGKGRIIYYTVNEVTNEKDLSMKNLIGIFIDGASTMVGHENDFISLKKIFQT